MQLHPLVLIWVSLYLDCSPINLHRLSYFFLVIEHIMHISVDEAGFANPRISHDYEFPIEVRAVFVVILGFKRPGDIHFY